MNASLARNTLGAVALATTVCAACAPPGVGRRPEPAPPVSVPEVDHSLFLIGDAGHALPGDRTMMRVTEFVEPLKDRATVIFLGDNIYPAGLPEPGDPYRRTAEAILEVQLDVPRLAGVRGIVIPGNHDWAHGGEDGWNAIRRQEEFVEAYAPNLEVLPDGGCPGPVVLDLSARLRVVILDTQWWFHEGAKPVHPDSPCADDSPEEVVASLREAIASAGDRHVVVLGHHPLATVGKHGGYFPLQDHLFPLRRVAKWLWIPVPFLGSVYPALRNLGLHDQDVSAGVYKRFVRAMEEAFEAQPPLAFVGAHDHSLQVLEGTSTPYVLVSGAGPSSGLGSVGWNDRTLYARGVCGFMRLDVLRDGRVRLGVFETCPVDGFRESYSQWLTGPPPP